MATLDEGWVLIYDNHDHDDETTIDREENSNVPQSLQKEFYDFHIALLVDVEVARQGRGLGHYCVGTTRRGFFDRSKSSYRSS